MYYATDGGVHKLSLQDEVDGPKMSTFCQRSYHRKFQQRGEGGQSQNIVNVVCERPLALRS